MPSLLTQTREVWVSFYIVFNVYTREITRVGTQNSAYKGNLGTKVLLF